MSLAILIDDLTCGPQRTQDRLGDEAGIRSPLCREVHSISSTGQERYYSSFIATCEAGFRPGQVAWRTTRSKLPSPPATISVRNEYQTPRYSSAARAS